MPKRTDIKSILVIGAGPIIIGQACEFDYSGTQAIKALKEDGYKVILVNSNPATIMTDPEVADETFIEPITTQYLEAIIQKTRPDALLPTVGGQTALNCTLELSKAGILDKYGVKLIGASIEAIEKAENRQLFHKAMQKIGLECPKNAIVKSIEQARSALESIGLPTIIRPSFTLGGAGSGIAHTEEEFFSIVSEGLKASPINEVLIDELIVGWKEYEMEVIRDKNDNAIIVCAIENIDPMGVHTGDSITVAPAITLTDKEYQRMRKASIDVLREIGVETGGSNVQFAVNPKDGRMVVIEMNPRVSRSSALASKATGFPIAKVAAKLAVGYSLDEVINDCTGTPASFEPVLDYIVTKIPRFTFEKFAAAPNILGSAMKSVGEVMGVGRCFKESLQKALCSLETGLTGLNTMPFFPNTTEDIKKALTISSSERLLLIAHAFRYDIDFEEIHKLTQYDPWFLRQIQELVQTEKNILINGIKEDKNSIIDLKKQGFSDSRLAYLSGKTTEEIQQLRHKLGVRPVFKIIDTCAGEFDTQTAYFYSTYEANCYESGDNEAIPTNKDKVIILGSGPNRIGQGIEFDYACVHAALALKKTNLETIMINCNPETVSTDYDTSDRLYFEPLTSEHVLEIIYNEQQNGKVIGVNVQFGGQTPLKLSKALEKAHINILGTSSDAIDLAEDRERFSNFIKQLNLKQPESTLGFSKDDTLNKAQELGYPVIVRPSYVLGGRSMAVIDNRGELLDYLDMNTECFIGGPLLIDRYLIGAKELDVDALGDGENISVMGIMEHVEEAGVHSGDSSCSLPTYSVSDDILTRIREQTIQIGKALKIKGLMNIQYAIQNNEVYILEVNPRASRTAPFVAKATGIPIASIAAKIMVGQASLPEEPKNSSSTSVKVPVFPFARFANTDILLGPEMKATGEVMCYADSFAEAFAKAQIAAGNKLPIQGNIFISVKDDDKAAIVELAKELKAMNFNILATKGTADFLLAHNIEITLVNKVNQGNPNIVDIMNEDQVDFVINTTRRKQSIADSHSIRRTALLRRVPYAITISGAYAVLQAIKWLYNNPDQYNVKSLQTLTQ